MWPDKTGTLSLVRLGVDLDFKYFGPILAGYEQPAPLSVVSDSVQHIFGLVFTPCHDGCQIDPRQHLTRARVDASDPRGMPDVGENLSVDVFELVQVRDCYVSCIHFECSYCFERSWIDELQFVRPVAQNQRRVVMCQTPAFGFVVKLSDSAKGAQVVDESNLRQP